MQRYVTCVRQVALEGVCVPAAVQREGLPCGDIPRGSRADAVRRPRGGATAGDGGVVQSGVVAHLAPQQALPRAASLDAQAAGYTLGGPTLRKSMSVVRQSQFRRPRWLRILNEMLAWTWNRARAMFGRIPANIAHESEQTSVAPARIATTEPNSEVLSRPGRAPPRARPILAPDFQIRLRHGKRCRWRRLSSKSQPCEADLGEILDDLPFRQWCHSSNPCGRPSREGLQRRPPRAPK